MSNVTFLKDHKGHKKGEVVPAMAFLKARDLVKAGVAVYTNQAPPAKGEAPAPVDESAAIRRARDEGKAAASREYAAEIDRLSTENARLRQELEAAQAQQPDSGPERQPPQGGSSTAPPRSQRK